MNYYPHHIGDYAKDTGHLSWDEDMAYTRLLRAYYSREKPIEAGETYRLAKATSKSQRAAVDSVLREFFTEHPDGWHNKRADAEIALATLKSEKARTSADKRWHSNTSNANAMRTHSEGNAPKNQEPITNNQKEKEERHQRSRGSRLPPDWEPTEDLKSWAEKERADLDPAATAAKFRDYWTAIPGSKGLKLDWDKTFRNFVRSEFAPRAGAVSHLAAVTKPKPRTCAYCEATAIGNANGYEHCRAHSSQAIFNEAPTKAA